MATELRKTGISVMGDVPWGTHYCHFYETKQDLLDTLIPYFKAGLESKEFCLWVVSNSELLTVEEAKGALRHAVPDLDRRLSDENIEILNGLDWYLKENEFNLERVTSAWDERLKRALAHGYDGMRISGDTIWLAEKDWKDFCSYEKQLNESINDRPMTILCTYPLSKSRATAILDVVQTHQFATARRQGEWEVIEAPELVQARNEIERLNEELELRVIERTRELAATNEQLRREINERKSTEALLNAKEQEFRAIVENATDQIVRYDREFRRTYVNPAVVNAYGLPAEALTGKPLGSVVQDAGLDVKEDEVAEVLQRIAAVFDTGKPYEFEVTWALPAGRRYYNWHLFPELDLNGSVINVLGISRDITERKLAEDELRRQKEILERIFDHIPLMINFVDADGRIRLVNREWERTMGWSLEEIQQDNLDIFAECYPDPQYRQQVKKFVTEATGEWTDFKTRVKDGRVLDMTWIRVRLADGTSIGIGNDITKRKQTEEALRESEERFRRYFELGLIGMAITSPDKGCLEVNDELCRLLGYTRSEMAQKTWPELTHPDDLAVDVAQFDRVVAGEIDGYSMDKRWIRKDGRVIDSIMSAQCLRNADGALDYFVCMVLDTTERKLAEEKLKHSESQLAEAQRLAHVGSWDFEIRSNTGTWSEELYRIFGLQPGEIDIARDAMSFVHPEDRDFVMSSIFNSSVKENEPYSFYYRAIRPDGDERILHSQGYVTSDEDGEPIRAFGATQDVTELKRTEEKLKSTSDQLRALSARLQSAREEEGARIAREIHDELGSALTSLRWDLEGIERVFSESGKRAQVSALRKKIGTMLGVIDTTINIVRRIASELRPSVLDDLGVAAAVKWHAQQFQDRTGIIVNCDCPRDDLMLNQEQSTAAFRIFQEALTNILRHAQATRVDVAIVEEAGAFILTIKDNGRGIREDEKSGPWSIGLLGMRERAHLIGGEIDITAVGGEGTAVTLRLPIVTPEVHPNPATDDVAIFNQMIVAEESSNEQ